MMLYYTQWSIAAVIMSDKKSKKIVIEGVTEEGKVFRPSDWAERMSGTLASFNNRRIHYSPMLQPGVNHEGYKCVVLDPKLKESSPQVYQAILDFAKANQLKICGDESPQED
jgi:Protein of unknown function (DUF3579)